MSQPRSHGHRRELKKRFAALGIAVVLLAIDSWAQRLSDSEFQLPSVGGPEHEVLASPKQRLLELVRNRRWPEAAALAARVLNAGEQDSQIHYLVGVVWWQQGEKVSAIQRFRAAERLGLTEPYLHKALGIAYYEAHQFHLFEQQMDRAAAANPSDPQPHHYLGRYALAVRGDFARALRHFEQVIALDADHARGHSYLAQCLERLDRRDAAERHYRKSVRLLERDGERFSWPYQGLARLALEADPLAAVEWSRRAVESEPDEFEAHALLARAHYRNGEAAEAIAAGAEAVRLNPDHAPSHYLLFTVHRGLGDSDAAQRHVTRFREIKGVYGDQ